MTEDTTKIVIHRLTFFRYDGTIPPMKHEYAVARQHAETRARALVTELVNDPNTIGNETVHVDRVTYRRLAPRDFLAAVLNGKVEPIKVEPISKFDPVPGRNGRNSVIKTELEEIY